MLRLEDPGVDAETKQGLDRYQAEVERAGDYAAQVCEGAALFARYNRRENSVFVVVHRQLALMCPGARRCGYCEDSAESEIDHFRPKALYPDRVFVWENYLPSCAPCNRKKGRRFAVLKDGDLVCVGRRRGGPVERPVAGPPAIIDPRVEEPMRILTLDLLGTFRFLPREGVGREDEMRANYTITVLQLNRDVLTESRRRAYADYRARLYEYRVRRTAGSPESELRPLRDGLLTSAHPTVWQEMQRQQARIDDLRRLFAEVPEALSW